MVVDTGTAILILGAFVLPGFITLTLRERLYIVRGEEARSSASSRPCSTAPSSTGFC
jgi:hypothetical protein